MRALILLAVLGLCICWIQAQDADVATTPADVGTTPEEEEDESSSSEEGEDGEGREGGGGSSGGGGSGGDDGESEESATQQPQEEPEEPSSSRKRKGKKRRPRELVDGILTIDGSEDNIVSYHHESSPCDFAQLAGFWYNNLGSELFIKKQIDGRFIGEYRTAVESECGSAGNTFSQVWGQYHGDLITFHVGFEGSNGLKSLTTWTGQCSWSCDPNQSGPVLKTMWTMLSQTGSCQDQWMNTRVGHDNFYRRQVASGPRRNEGTNLPESRSDCELQREKRRSVPKKK